MQDGWRLRCGSVLLGVVVLSGCAVKFSQRSPWDIQQIQTLSGQLEQYRGLAQLKADEIERLRAAKAALEQRLSSEISAEDISVGFDERGLVVRVLDQVLFDSGKAQIRQEAHPVLNQVSRILNEELAGQPVWIEGHTDNESIKFSPWKDNWELSLARARSVLTYLAEEQGLDPSRLSAAGFGEYRPIASNETAEGRQMNRRVEIVVQPHRVAKGSPSGSLDEAPRGAATFK